VSKAWHNREKITTVKNNTTNKRTSLLLSTKYHAKRTKQITVYLKTGELALTFFIAANIALQLNQKVSG